MRIVLCDNCGDRIHDGVIRLVDGDGDYCSVECSKPEPEDEGCQHEDNMSDEVAGRATARKICKQCGYDREEAVTA